MIYQADQAYQKVIEAYKVKQHKKWLMLIKKAKEKKNDNKTKS